HKAAPRAAYLAGVTKGECITGRANSCERIVAERESVSQNRIPVTGMLVLMICWLMLCGHGIPATKNRTSLLKRYPSKEATTGFEPVIKVLQTSALPLGYVANHRYYSYFEGLIQARLQDRAIAGTITS